MNMNSLQTPLPSDAIDWIADYLQSISDRNFAENVRDKQRFRRGVQELSVNEVKMLLNELVRNLSNPPKLPSIDAPKSSFVTTLHQCFFEDPPECKMVAEKSSSIWRAVKQSRIKIAENKKHAVLQFNNANNRSNAIVRTGVENEDIYSGGTAQQLRRNMTHFSPYPPNPSYTPYPSYIQPYFSSNPTHSITHAPPYSYQLGHYYNGFQNNSLQFASLSPAYSIYHSYPQPMYPQPMYAQPMHAQPMQLPSSNSNSSSHGVDLDSAMHNSTNIQANQLSCEETAGTKRKYDETKTLTAATPSKVVKTNSDLNKSSGIKIRVKQEKEDVCYMTPSNSLETRILKDLRGLGFGSIVEALKGIRHAIKELNIEPNDFNPHGSTSEIVDLSVLWIVSQRETADEARCLDEARRISEISREEEGIRLDKRRRENEKSLLSNSSISEILHRSCAAGKDQNSSQFFLTSVILKSEVVRSALHVFCEKGNSEAKAQIIRYLTLEKKAIKWYGLNTTYAYFEYESLSNLRKGRGKNVDDDWIVAQQSSLCAECELLENALYSLAEQDMNVPKVFLQARKKARELNLPLDFGNEVAVNNNSEDDDEVVVLAISNDKLLGINEKGKKDCVGSHEHDAKPIDVIEII